ncbi:MAG: Sec-independent protein translocase protein TatA 2 [bacterium]|nr:MAG: Sec-independent protein translocase protein TatA 2 [bacterium]
MFGGFGLTELIIILVIVLVLFGAKKIPQLGSGLGEGIRNFTKSLKSQEEEEKEKTEQKGKSKSETNTG